MIKKIKGYTVKFTAGMVLATTLMSTASMAASASGLQVQAKGSVVATQQVASVTASDVASVEGNDVVSVSANNVVRVGAGKTDDAVVEDQGNMNSSQYAVDSVVDENADWHEGDGDMNPFHKYYQKARDMVANKNHMDEVRKADEEARKAREEQQAEESRRAEQFKKAEEAKLEEYAKKVHEDRIAAEGQGDVIDDQFAYVEGQGDVIDDQFAVATDDASATVNADAQSKTDDAKKADEENKVDKYGLREEDKSEDTKKFKMINDALYPIRVKTGINDEVIDNMIDKIDKEGFGSNEKTFLKEFGKTVYNTAEGTAMGEIIPGIGGYRNLLKYRELLSEAMDAKTPEQHQRIMQDANNCLKEGIVSCIPGGSLVLSGTKIVLSTTKYVTNTIGGIFGLKVNFDINPLHWF